MFWLQLVDMRAFIKTRAPIATYDTQLKVFRSLTLQQHFCICVCVCVCVIISIERFATFQLKAKIFPAVR